MKTIFSNNVTKKGLFNMQASALSLQSVEEDIEVSGAAKLFDEEEGKEVGFLIATDGTAYSTISETAIRAIDQLEEWDFEEDPCTVKVVKRRSKGGRDFITLQIL